jgi:hypothetical protein
MPSPIPVFVPILLLFGLFGLLVGMLNILNPEAVYIPFGSKGESAEGIDGVSPLRPPA